MSYKPYPSSGKSQLPAGRPPAPQPVRNAVKLMYAGAVISVVGPILFFITISSLKPAIRKQYPHYSITQVNHTYTQLITQEIVSAVIGVGLWLLMAWANGKGMSWARIVSSVLFAVNTLGLIAYIRLPQTAVSLAFSALIWVAGAGAIWFLWRPESNNYFKPQGYA